MKEYNDLKLVFDIYLETTNDLKKVKTFKELDQAIKYCKEKNERIPNVRNDEYYYFLSRKREKDEN